MSKLKNLKLWTHPQNYMGTTWEDYYVFLSQTRDSDALERSNFIKGLEAIGGEDPEMLVTAGANHWAYGWLDTIYIHKNAHTALQKADEIMGALEDYPVVDEEHYCELENDEAQEVWKNCYDPKERIEFYRKHEPQWYSFKELLQSVRTGDAFYGYASDLLT